MPVRKSKNKKKRINREKFREDLLGWYDRSGRDLPWRYKNGAVADPYRVWLSEIMLQQTTVTAVKPYYMRFLERWPDVRALASAKREEIMKEWAGLGYYSRARNLHACAQVVANDLKGVFPEEQKSLMQLCGIGDYTSAAIRAIAFNKPAVVVDGNIERIASRVFAVTEPLPGSKPLLKEKAAAFYEGFEARPGDLAQALMDLGATICTPKSPKCMLCPVNAHCEAYAIGIAEQLPARVKAKDKPRKFGYVYHVTNEKGEILLQTRPDKGLLAGMTGFPTSDWEAEFPGHPAWIKGEPEDLGVSVYHGFTHFDLQLDLKKIEVARGFRPGEGYFWADTSKLGGFGFPTVFGKALNLFLNNGLFEVKWV